jgi:hypothetical protein
MADRQRWAFFNPIGAALDRSGQMMDCRVCVDVRVQSFFCAGPLPCCVSGGKRNVLR